MNEFIITGYEAGQRLDKYLHKYFNEAPTGFVYKMLRKKRIKLNGMRAAGNEFLAPGDRLIFYISPETMDKLMSARIVHSAAVLDIVYEDENILAVNKPRGVLTHSQRAEDTDTMIDRCLGYLYEAGAFSAAKNSVFTPAFCNRLDRNTSGIVVCGKNPAALRELNRVVAERGVNKLYLAVVKGMPEPEREIISHHQKDKAVNRAYTADNGKEMITSFRRISTNGSYSLLSVRLVTGRAHQIRVQLSSIGHPIAGDIKYGGKTLGVETQLLHAERIIFDGLGDMLGYLNGMELCAPPDKWFTDKTGRLLGSSWAERWERA